MTGASRGRFLSVHWGGEDRTRGAFRRLLFGFTVLACAVVLVGCAVRELPPVIMYGTGNPPVFMLVYHPYGASSVRRIAAPMPNYHGWTEERMERDWVRFRRLGIDVVLVTVDLSDVTEKFKLESYTRFFRVAESGGGRDHPKIALCLRDSTGEHGGAASLRMFTNWHITNGLGRSPAHFRLNGRPLVLLGEGTGRLRGNHPALAFVRAVGAGAPWTLTGSASGGVFQLSADGHQAFVSGGCVGGGAVRDERAWATPRLKGKTLRRALWAAFSAEARYIVVSSWNDFAAGDFVEPNTLDGESALDVLVKEMARARGALPPNLY